MTSAEYRDPVLPRITSLALDYVWPLPKIERATVRALVSDSGLRLERAFFDLAPVDLNKAVLPFGDAPRPNDTFYIASAGFAPPSESVVLTIVLTNPTRSGGGTPPPAAPSDDLTLAWEYWDEAGEWRQLGESGPGAAPGPAAWVRRRD